MPLANIPDNRPQTSIWPTPSLPRWDSSVTTNAQEAGGKDKADSGRRSLSAIRADSDNSREGVKRAIAQAARKTDVNFDFLLAQARLESGLNPEARATTSSATGLYQFVTSTWLATLDKHGKKHGLAWAAEAIERGSKGHFVSDTTVRAELLALRNDPVIASAMAGELASDNARGLVPVLGRKPDPAELYLAHFLGVGGARTFLRALKADPGQSAVELMPRPAAANRPIFYSGDRERSVEEVMTVIRKKMDKAISIGGSPPPPGPLPAARPSRKPHAEEPSAPNPNRPGPPVELWKTPFSREPSPSLIIPAVDYVPTPARPSMAETLQIAFGGTNSLPKEASARIASAYQVFKAVDV